MREKFVFQRLEFLKIVISAIFYLFINISLSIMAFLELFSKCDKFINTLTIMAN